MPSGVAAQHLHLLSGRRQDLWPRTLQVLPLREKERIGAPV